MYKSLIAVNLKQYNDFWYKCTNKSQSLEQWYVLFYAWIDFKSPYVGCFSIYMQLVYSHHHTFLICPYETYLYGIMVFNTDQVLYITVYITEKLTVINISMKY